MRVSEKVTIDEINKWQPGDIVTIKAGTGVGKSYFIKNNLYAIAKKNRSKILMLLHRRNCVDQFVLEIIADKKTDVIDIVTYQSIEAGIRRGKKFDFNNYDYVICDEFHYFMSDASFNKYTDMSLNAILKQTDKIRIFMSATGDYMKMYINNIKKLKTIDHDLPINFDFIKKLTFYNKDSTLDVFMKEAIESKQKAIFFIQSAERAYEFYKKHKEYCLFNCSKDNEKYYKHVDEEKINKMLTEESFNELVLVTTTTMDAGVNIIDDQLKHIVCDVKDIGTLIQCMGRKRLQNKYDHIFLYIKTITNQQLGGMETQLSKKLEMARYLRKNGLDEYIKKYPRELDYSNITYDEVVEGETDKGTKKINWLMYFKCTTDASEVQMMKSLGKFGYCKALAQKFGFYSPYEGYDYRLIEEDKENRELEAYLDSMVGDVMLQVKDRKELIEKVNVRDGNNNRLLKNIDTLNAKLKEVGLNYLIDQYQTSRVLDGKKKNYKSAWRVRRLTDC